MNFLEALGADINALFNDMENKAELEKHDGDVYPVGYFWAGEFINIGHVSVRHGVATGVVFEGPFIVMWNRLEYSRPLKAVWYESPKHVELVSARKLGLIVEPFAYEYEREGWERRKPHA
jgi:hypothetical protein